MWGEEKRREEGKHTIARSSRNATLDVAYIIRALCVRHLCSRFDNPFYKPMTPVLPGKYRKLVHARSNTVQRIRSWESLVASRERNSTSCIHDVTSVYSSLRQDVSWFKRRSASPRHPWHPRNFCREQTTRDAYLHHLENAQVRR